MENGGILNVHIGSGYILEKMITYTSVKLNELPILLCLKLILFDILR